jgi:hypothetical protein
MITDNKYIDIAHTISLNCVYSDGSKNYIKAILEFAEVYHEMELKKLRVADVMSSCNHKNKTNYCNTDGSYSHKTCDDCGENIWD